MGFTGKDGSHLCGGDKEIAVQSVKVGRDSPFAAVDKAAQGPRGIKDTVFGFTCSKGTLSRLYSSDRSGAGGPDWWMEQESPWLGMWHPVGDGGAFLKSMSDLRKTEELAAASLSPYGARNFLARHTALSRRRRGDTSPLH